MLSSCLRRSGVALSGSLSALRAPQLLRVSSAVSQPQRFFSTSTTVTASPRGFLNRMSACRTPLPVLATLAQPRRHFGSVDFALADIGEGIAEVEIMQWMVEEGDYVKEFQELCEVQSDKATVTITSRYEGTVKEICYAVGEMASVGTALVKMEVEGEGDSSPSSSDAAPAAAAAAAPSSSSSPSSAASPSSTPPPVDFSTTNAEVRASPAVRHLAKQHNIDLRLVVGTGPKGRIVKHDVNQVISGAVPIATAAPTGGIAAAAVDDAPHTKLPMRPAFVAPIGEDVEVPVTGLARLMVKSMDAANKVPQFGYADEICMDGLIALRTSLKPAAASMGVKLSYLPLILKATSLALSQYPQLNAHANSDCSAVTHKASHNIGIAVDTPRGLLVPNIKNVQQLTIFEIAAEVQRLAELGQAGKLGADDLTGGTFTLSNVGSIGGTYTKPILVVPEVVIGAFGKFQKLPRYNEQDELVPTTIMNVSWSADHRVVDGATIARFSNLWKEMLESPGMMLVYTR